MIEDLGHDVKLSPINPQNNTKIAHDIFGGKFESNSQA
jgi:hypothetical protein